MSLAHSTKEAQDTATIPPLPPSAVYWAALVALHTATAPLAPQEQREVAADADRRRRALPTGDLVTLFHCSCLPGMPFPNYAVTAAQNAGYGREGLGVGLALMARYAVATKRGITPLSVHRLFATCMQVGMKATSDKFLKNSRAAPVFGMALAELNAMERALVRELDFGLIPTLAEFTDLPAALAHHGVNNDAGRWDHTALYAVLASHNHQVRTVEDSATPPTTPSTDALMIADSQRTSAAARDSGASYLPLSPRSSGTAAASWSASPRVRVCRGARVPSTTTISADADDQ